MYEVRRERVADVAGVVAREMERAWELRVPTPVKLSVGPSWGELREVSPADLQRLQAASQPHGQQQH